MSDIESYLYFENAAITAYKEDFFYLKYDSGLPNGVSISLI